MRNPSTESPSRKILLLITAIRFSGFSDHDIACSLNFESSSGATETGIASAIFDGSFGVAVFSGLIFLLDVAAMGDPLCLELFWGNRLAVTGISGRRFILGKAPGFCFSSWGSAEDFFVILSGLPGTDGGTDFREDGDKGVNIIQPVAARLIIPREIQKGL